MRFFKPRWPIIAPAGSMKRLDSIARCSRSNLVMRMRCTCWGWRLRRRACAAEGVKLIQRAILLRPNVAVFHANLGYSLRLMGRPGDAAAAWRRAVSLDPTKSSAWFNLSQTLAEIGHPNDAIDACKRALALNPGLAEANNHLGAILREQRRIDESAACLRQAIEVNPLYAEAHHNLALSLAESGRIDLAVESEARAIESAPDVTACASGRNYMLHFHPAFDLAALGRELRPFNQRFAQPLAANVQPYSNNRDPDRRLKIGYVSPDFYFQAECFFVASPARIPRPREF